MKFSVNFVAGILCVVGVLIGCGQVLSYVVEEKRMSDDDADVGERILALSTAMKRFKRSPENLEPADKTNNYNPYLMPPDWLFCTFCTRHLYPICMRRFCYSKILTPYRSRVDINQK